MRVQPLQHRRHAQTRPKRARLPKGLRVSDRAFAPKRLSHRYEFPLVQLLECPRQRTVVGLICHIRFGHKQRQASAVLDRSRIVRGLVRRSFASGRCERRMPRRRPNHGAKYSRSRFDGSPSSSNYPRSSPTRSPSHITPARRMSPWP